MKTIKCISCNNLFEENKKNESIKVTLSNPGDVFCEGMDSVRRKHPSYSLQKRKSIVSATIYRRKKK